MQEQKLLENWHVHLCISVLQLNENCLVEKHHDLKEVKKAAKKAKAFETQKLVKKLKGLR
jgi:hypothetical protein